MKTIKSKIRIGLLFLFTVILMLSILGILFINQLAQKSKGTIVDNYSSIDYTIKMLKDLDDMFAYQVESTLVKKLTDSSEKVYLTSKNSFEKNLQLETTNITEKGEAELVNGLHSKYRIYLNSFDQLRKIKADHKELMRIQDEYMSVKSAVFAIYELNMVAVNVKTNQLQTSADDIILYMSIVALLSIIITLFFIFNFPSKIVEPIKELTGKIKSISERNYDQKLDINTEDELGELSNAFNIMAEKLKLYEAKQIDQLLFEQKRLEAVVHSFEDGILLIDEKRKIVLANETVLQIAGLVQEEILNHSVNTVAESNDLIR